MSTLAAQAGLKQAALVRDYSMTRNGYVVMIEDRQVGELYAYHEKPNEWHATLKLPGRRIDLKANPDNVWLSYFRSRDTAARMIEKLALSDKQLAIYVERMERAATIRLLESMATHLSLAASNAAVGDPLPEARQLAARLRTQLVAMRVEVLALLASVRGAVAPAAVDGDLSPTLGAGK